MTIEYDDKGKVFTDVVSKVAIPSVVQTTQHLIRGNIHVHRNERLKDELDRDELFLAMTDVSMAGVNGQETHEARFVAVRRAQIVWVMPAHEAQEAGEQ